MAMLIEPLAMIFFSQPIPELTEMTPLNSLDVSWNNVLLAIRNSPLPILDQSISIVLKRYIDPVRIEVIKFGSSEESVGEIRLG
jgi:hypothetical protein